MFISSFGLKIRPTPSIRQQWQTMQDWETCYARIKKDVDISGVIVDFDIQARIAAVLAQIQDDKEKHEPTSNAKRGV